MTGRRLYEHHSEARQKTIGTRPIGSDTGFREQHSPVTWAYLPWREQHFWNELAARITPTKRTAR